MQSIRIKKDWLLTPEAFQRLLDWLDRGANSKGQKYLEMHRCLIAYFDRKNCPAPQELADETINRVARRLEDERAIESEIPAKYCYITARFVFLEHLRGRAKDQRVRNEFPRESRDEMEEQRNREIRERMLDCLDRCAGKLDSRKRELILQYYFGQERVKIENRRALAKALDITMNALSIRACRIRDKLEACVRQCVGGNETIS